MSPKAKKAKARAKPAGAGQKATSKKPARKTAAQRKTKTAKTGAKKEKVAKSGPATPRKKAEPVKRAKAVATKPRKKPTPSGAPKKKKPRRVRLGPKQVEHYRELLQEKQRGLTAAYQTSKGESRSDLDDGTEDYIDYAVHSYAKEFLLSLTEMDRKQLYLVDEALERLGRNQFGHCQQCQQPIHPKRLEVAPWARYCVPCQEMEEQGILPELAESEVDDEQPAPTRAGETDSDGSDAESLDDDGPDADSDDEDLAANADRG
jgi:DnaK suppressor protein